MIGILWLLPVAEQLDTEVDMSAAVAEWVQIATTGDLKPGQMKMAVVRGYEILLAR